MEYVKFVIITLPRYRIENHNIINISKQGSSQKQKILWLQWGSTLFNSIGKEINKEKIYRTGILQKKDRNWQIHQPKNVCKT